MSKFNRFGYLLGAGIATTPCCDREIDGKKFYRLLKKHPSGDCVGTVRCIECDKPYNVTIEDFLIASITPIEDAIA